LSTKIYKNIQYERQAVLTALRNENAVDDLVEQLNKEIFTDGLSLKTFNWIKEKYNQNEDISLIDLDDQTDINAEKLTNVGIQELEYDNLLKVLQKLHQRRKLYQGAKDIVELTKNTELSIEELNNKAQDKIFDITYNPESGENIYDMYDVLNKFHEEVLRIQDKEGELSGINTGIPTMDAALKGLHPGHLFTIAAPTHHGKTSLSLQIALNLIKREKSVVMFSLEMDAVEIGRKMVALDSHVPTSAYQQKLEDYQKKNMEATFDRLMDLHFTLSDERGLTPADIKAKCRKIKRTKNIDLIVIDYLQNMTYSEGENREDRIGNTVLNLRNLAGELNVPIILNSQMNRSVDGKPSMSQTRGSGRIEEISDEVLLIYRKNFKPGVRKGVEEVDIIVEKGRTTGGCKMTMDFYRDIQAWRDKNAEEIDIKR